MSFAYEDTPPTLKEINLTISKGEKLAIVGASGQGKSTLIDVLTGLIAPTNGVLSVDGIEIDSLNMASWRSKIGYVPQSVYLFEASVKDNVLLGREYDESWLTEVLRISNILDHLDTKEGVNTMVGDEGGLISGGQKQRIALARALYGKPEVLVLDEATSALDEKTASNILQEVNSLPITIITVTHRTETLAKNQVVYQVENGNVRMVRGRT